MHYFAYGSNLNARAVADWAKHMGLRPPPMKHGKSAVVDNYRLCFPIYSEYWGGGIADIEFMVQYAVLRWAHDHPELLRWTDNIRLLETLEQTGLLPAADARLLADCFRAYRARIHRLALQEIESAVVDAEELAGERAAVTALWQRLMEAPPASGGP